jgi:hypothetical protein
MSRQQIHPYVPPELRKRLRIFAGRKGVSESAVAQTALLRYLDDSNEGPQIMRRLDRVNRQVARVHRDVDILAEAFSVFVQLWLAHTPRLPESEMAAAERSALSRFSQFLDHLAAKVATGRSFLDDIAPEDGPEAGATSPTGERGAEPEGAP